MGSVLKITKGYTPSILKPAVEDYKRDLPKLKLFDPYQNKRLSTILEGIRQLKSRFNGEILIRGICSSSIEARPHVEGFREDDEGYI
jgi:uroporphyrinogen-III decarboxylase